MHTQKEQKVITLFMTVLFLAIIMVYILLFQVKGSVLKPKAITTSGAQIQISIMSGDTEQVLTPTNDTRENLTASGESVLTETTNTNTGFNVLTESTNIKPSSGNIKLLSGTNVFYGTITAIEKLGIKYKYALIDSKYIYYVNLGVPTYDFASIARKLGGNLFEIKTEADLLKNKLFGEKVVFVNLPEYKEKMTIMLLYIDQEVWLLQMDYALYHKSKAYIKSLFIQ